MGTPDVAVPALDAVLDSRHDVVAVVTQPDRVRGRGRSVSASPVKARAMEAGVESILQPESPKTEDFAAALAELEPDALAVVAYGHILSRAVLDVAPAINVHFSLLPSYRGAAPVQRAVMDGVTETGVSVFLLEPTVDSGPVLARESIPVGPDDTSGDVFGALVPIGARLLVGCLDVIEDGTAEPVPQDPTGASPAPKIKAEETAVDFTMPASRVHNLIRALAPRPGAATTFRGKRLNIWRTRVRDDGGPPGAIIDAAEGLVVACGDGAVELVEVQPEGKKRMDGRSFVNGYRPTVGEPLGGERPGR